MLITRSRFFLSLALTPMAAAIPAAVHAQREIVQPLPGAEEGDLKLALIRLASDPKSVAALTDAGKAALALGDIEAAIGFFGRADALDPGNVRVKLGMANAYVATRRPVEALRLFAEAERAGADVAMAASERGLAFDLVGDTAAAQQQYRLALSRSDNPQVRERLAISQAVSGDLRGFEATLLPLLKAQDLAAFRTRAFGLAILRQEKEAAKLVSQVMPPQLAQSFLPYLRQLPQLSAVEQIAAVHLGVFPAAAPQARMAAQSPSTPPLSRPANSQAGQLLTPTGPPLGGQMELPPTAKRIEVPDPSLSKQPIVQPIPTATPRRDVAAVFAGLTPAATAAPAPGTVDVAQLEARRDPKPVPKPVPSSAPAAKPPAAPAKSVKPAHPARVWVQLAAGADREALAFDWRRLLKQGGKTLAGKEPYVVAWGRTNRLLAGPYPTVRAADAAVTALREEGMDSFRYQSPEGQEVTRLK